MKYRLKDSVSRKDLENLCFLRTVSWGWAEDHKLREEEVYIDLFDINFTTKEITFPDCTDTIKGIIDDFYLLVKNDFIEVVEENDED